MIRKSNTNRERRPGATRTRRRVLRGAGATLAAAALGAGRAAGQATETGRDDGASDETEPGPTDPSITTRGVVIEQAVYDQEITGFWIHLAAELDPTVASVDDDCEYVDWTDDATRAFDAQLIDRSADPEQQRITLYLHEDVRVSPGTLFIVNEREQCQSGYLGVELERVGADLVSLWADDLGTPTPDGGGGVAPGTDAVGPGLGLGGGLAGLLGAGWLLGRRRGDVGEAAPDDAEER